MNKELEYKAFPTTDVFTASFGTVLIVPFSTDQIAAITNWTCDRELLTHELAVVSVTIRTLAELSAPGFSQEQEPLGEFDRFAWYLTSKYGDVIMLPRGVISVRAGLDDRMMRR